MERNERLATILATATVVVLVAALAWLGDAWLRGRSGAPGPERARRLPPPRVDAWVGDLAPGLKGVLAPVWGDPKSDAEHDRELNDGLAIEDPGLAWYRLLLFNTSDEERTVTLQEGALSIRTSDSESPVPLRNLSELLERGQVGRPPERLRSVLKTLGALEKEVRIPAGSMASLVVPFGRRVDLERAVEVASAEGAVFRRRRMPRDEFQELLASPDEDRIKDL